MKSFGGGQDVFRKSHQAINKYPLHYQRAYYVPYMTAGSRLFYSSSKNIKLVKLFSHKKYLPPCSLLTPQHRRHPFSLDVCVSVYVCVCDSSTRSLKSIPEISPMVTQFIYFICNIMLQ